MSRYVPMLLFAYGLQPHGPQQKTHRRCNSTGCCRGCICRGVEDFLGPRRCVRRRSSMRCSGRRMEITRRGETGETLSGEATLPRMDGIERAIPWSATLVWPFQNLTVRSDGQRNLVGGPMP
jgi:hypothetical protein